MAVRRESVRLSLEDAGYSTGMARAAASTMLLDRALESLGGSHGRVQQTTSTTSKDVDRLSDAAVRGSASIDQYSGRLRILAEAVATLGPGLLAIGAGGIVAGAGLAALFGGGAVAALGMVVAVQGVGDALKAVEKARLDPTVENLKAADEALAQLSPHTQEFVTRFQEIRPILMALRDAGAEAFFPGLTASLDSLEKLEPTLQRLLAASGKAGGDAIAASADSLASDRWKPFLNFLEREIPDAVDSATSILGSFAHTGAELWMAFDPTNDRFIDWLTDVADGLDRWAGSNEGQQDIRSFLAYVQDTGPQVRDFIVAVADALTQVVQAAAPLSGPVLETLTAVSNIVADIADSDIGTPILSGVAALTLYTRGLQLAATLQTKLTGSTALSGAMASGGMFGMLTTGARNARSGVQGAVTDLRAMRQEYTRLGATQAVVLSGLSRTTGAAERTADRMKTLGKTSAIVGGLAVASTGAADSIGLTNTASLALMGSFAGPWGVAIGAAIGGMRDLDAATKGFSDTVADVEKNITDGKFSDAADELARLKEQAKDSNEMSSFGDALDDVGKGLERVATGDFGFLFGADEDKIRELTKSLKAAKQAAADQAEFDALADRYGTTADKAGAAARQTNRLKAAITSLNIVVDQQAAWDDYQASIDNVTASIKENGRTLNSDTVGGRAVRESIRDLVTSGQKFSETLSGISRLRFLQGLLGQFDSAVKAAGGATKATRDLRHELSEELRAAKVEIDTTAIKGAQNKIAGLEDLMGNLDGVTATPKVDLNKKPFDAKGTYVENYLTMITGKGAKPKVTLNGVGAAESALAHLTRPRTATITTQWRNVYAPPKPNPSRSNPGLGLLAPGSADGSTVPDDGGPYADRYPYMLAPREEVVTNRAGQADTFRPELKDINAGMSRRDVIERMLLRGLADGGTVSGLAGGGTTKAGKKPPTKVAALQFADLPALNLAAMSLKQLNKALKASEKALERETNQREAVLSKMTDLRSAVSGRVTSELFGETNVWTSGGTVADAIAKNRADSAKASLLSKQIAILKSKGLDGPALDELLSKADDATLANFVAASKSSLAQYESSFEVRAGKAGATASFAANAAYGAELRLQTREMQAVASRVSVMTNRVERVEKAIRQEHAKDRQSKKRGAGSGRRSTKKG